MRKTVVLLLVMICLFSVPVLGVISGGTLGDACYVDVIGDNACWDLEDIYIYNMSGAISFNESKLNATIDARSGGASGNGKEGDLIYLYNDSTTMFLNETKLNQTIDDRDNAGTVETNISILHASNETSGEVVKLEVADNGALKLALITQSNSTSSGDNITNIETNATIFYGINESSGLEIPLEMTSGGEAKLAVLDWGRFSQNVTEQFSQALCMRTDSLIGYCTTSVNATGGCTCV